MTVALEAMQWEANGFVVTTDPRRFDMDLIHDFLANQAYWSQGIPRQTLERSITNSLGFALLHENRQVGFARVISDFATFAYLGDVFVVEAYRGRGLSRWLMECVVSHPDLQGLRRWALATSEAHGLYRKFGFTPLAAPERFMELFNPDVYLSPRDMVVG